MQKNDNIQRYVNSGQKCTHGAQHKWRVCREVTITRTDNGATTAVTSLEFEYDKDYGSWNQALDDANELQLLNNVEAMAARLLPRGLPFHGSADFHIGVLFGKGFVCNKEPAH